MFAIKLLFIFIIFCCVPKTSLGYDILVVFPEPTKSHGILGDGYVRLLLKANHKVTYITPFPWKDPPSNLMQIDISSNLNNSDEVLKNLTIEYSSKSTFLLMLSYTFGKMVVTHPAVQAFLRNPEHTFDVIIAEWIDSEMYSSFAGFFNCPLIWSVSTQLYWQPLRIMDEVSNPAYSADINSGYTPPLNFARRIYELTTQTRKIWTLHYTIRPLELELYDTVFGSAAMTKGMALKPYDDIPKNYSMMLVNTHPSVATPWRVPPSVKEIAGYHINLPPEPLNPDLKSIMDASQQGVIYFSMGTTNPGKDIPFQVRQELLKLFGQLKQTVLWKMEIPLENVPSNVHLMAWAPQTSILNHTNTKIFISHGGMLSVIEAVHFGVPIVAVPRHADQFTNVDAIVRKGIAIRLDYDNNFPSSLRNALKKIMEDKSYVHNMKRVSSIYHDRPIPPSKELVHWVEHVIRNRGANHLQSPALLVPSYQKFYLDLAALIVAIIVISLTLIILAVRWCVKRIKMKLCHRY